MYTRFQNRDNECFGCSLANYFDLIGQESLAERIYDEFRMHRFVAKDGSSHPELSTYLVKDLTKGRYTSTFLYGGFNNREELLHDNIEHEMKDAFKVIKNEEKLGNLNGGLEFFTYTGPTLLLQDLQSSRFSHWFVDCDDGTIIDNGVIRERVNQKRSFVGIKGGLLIKRV